MLEAGLLNRVREHIDYDGFVGGIIKKDDVSFCIVGFCEGNSFKREKESMEMAFIRYFVIDLWMFVGSSK